MRPVLTIYEVTQGYGGREEGGWWFDVYEPIAYKTITTNKSLGKEKVKMEKEFSHLKSEHEKSSACGDGNDIVCLVENFFGEYATWKKPEYC